MQYYYTCVKCTPIIYTRRENISQVEQKSIYCSLDPINMDKRAVLAVIVVIAVVVVGVAGYVFTRGDSSDAIQYTKVDPSKQLDSIKEGTIDAGVLWEPYATAAEMSGGAEVLVWSEEFWPGHPCCVVAVDDKFAQKNPDAIIAFLAAQIKALNWINEAMDENSPNHQALIDITKDHTGLKNDSEIMASLSHMELTYEMNNNVQDGEKGFNDWLEYYVDEFINQEIISEKNLKARGCNNSKEFIDKIVNGDYLESAKELGEDYAGLSTQVTMRIGQLNGDLHQLAVVVAMSPLAGEDGKSMLEQFNINAVSGTKYPSGKDVMTAFIGGELDIAYVGSPPVIQHLAQHTDLGVSIIACANTNGSAVIVKEGMFDEGMTLEEKIQGLKGKVVGIPMGSIQQLMLLYLGAQYDVKVSSWV